MRVKTKLRVYISSPNVLGVKAAAKNQQIEVEPGKKYKINIEHNIYQMLAFEGKPCNKEKFYRLDECIFNELEKKSMEKIGCTTPFGQTKDNICIDGNKSIYRKKCSSLNTVIPLYSGHPI